MFRDIKRSYTVAFTVRSGSNAVCDLLARNNLGSPSEWFQLRTAPDGQSRIDDFTHIINAHQVGGIFGSKMMHDHRARLDELLRGAIPKYRRLDDLLPSHRWVWLVRKDKILQAVSLCRAQDSGSWSALKSTDSRTDGFHYDFFHILSNLMIILAGEYAWKVYFEEHGIDPFQIVYEDFFENVDSSLAELIHYLGGLPSGHEAMTTSQTFRVQRDTKNYEARAQFISDLSRVGEESFARQMGEANKKWEAFFFEQQWR